MFGGRLDQAVEAIRAASQAGERVVIATNQDQRLRELLLESDLYPMARTNPPRAGCAAGESRAAAEGCDRAASCRCVPVGWRSAPLGALLLTDRELFGVQPITRRPARRAQSAARAFIEGLEEGQYVVHIEHGVGIYRGLVTLTTSGAAREYLLIEYAGADRLYVPVDQTDRVAPYPGGRHGADGA